MLEPINKSVYK